MPEHIPPRALSESHLGRHVRIETMLGERVEGRLIHVGRIGDDDLPYVGIEPASGRAWPGGVVRHYACLHERAAVTLLPEPPASGPEPAPGAPNVAGVDAGSGEATDV
jgi:hypothetical protein